MIGLQPSRVRPKNRSNTPSDKTPEAQHKTYTAPIAGLVTNTSLATAGSQSAVVLENFWPTTTGIEPRGGTRVRATILNQVVNLFEYRGNVSPEYFVSDDNNIYEFSDTTPDETALTATVTGQSSGEYSTHETQTDGGSYLVAVNGSDNSLIYDGTSWQVVTDISTPFAITGIDTSLLSYVWAYQNRLFFIESGTMNAWYLGINSVAGAATKLPLTGVFNNGGSLLFGAMFSSDSGDGLDDRCIFFTTEGEFAIYNGDPADANSWNREGRYDIGKILGTGATMSIGGDVIVATKAGLIPISAAVNKDAAELKMSAISRNFEPDYRRQAILAGNLGEWRLVKWVSRNLAVIAPIQSDASLQYCWAINLETKAWSKITGWGIEAVNVMGDSLYYGDAQGNIRLCDTGGTDSGSPFECRACFGFDHMGQPGAFKTANLIKGTWRHRTPFVAKHTIAVDYKPSFGSSPPVSVESVSEFSQSLWDIATWDESDWADDDDSYQIFEQWDGASGHGETLAPQIQVLSNQDYKLDCELVSVDLIYSAGSFLT